MILDTQTFLRQNPLEEITTQYGIIVKRHQSYPNLVMFKYDQIHSPMQEHIVQECRGLILDEQDNWKVVSCPFFKFFNLGEPNAHQIDWDEATVYEKMDGSLMTLYWYDGAWQVASNGLPDASGSIGSGQVPSALNERMLTSFRDLFWEQFTLAEYSTKGLNPETCYMFEMVTPWNRVVCNYGASSLMLIGARDLLTLKEQPLRRHQARFSTPFEMDFKDAQAAVDSAAQLHGISCEGYVVVDKNFNRVKIKSPSYLKLHRLKDNGSYSFKRMLDIIRANEDTEFLTYFPEFQPLFDNVRTKYEAFLTEVESKWVEVKAIADKKAFALTVKDLGYSSILFGLHTGKIVSLKQHIAEIPLDRAEQYVSQ